MLNDEAVVSPPSPLPSPPRQAPQSFPPPAVSPQRTQLLSLQRSRLRFIYVGAGTALLGALALFFVLFHHNGAVVPKARAAAGPVAAPAPAVPAPTPSAAASAAAPPTEAPKQQEAANSEPVQFRIKRSRAFERVGPIRLRLVKANPRWNICNLYVAAGGPSFQKQLHLNKPVQIDLPNGSGSAELVVTSIRGDQISGSVQTKQ